MSFGLVRRFVSAARLFRRVDGGECGKNDFRFKGVAAMVSAELLYWLSPGKEPGVAILHKWSPIKCATKADKESVADKERKMWDND